MLKKIVHIFLSLCFSAGLIFLLTRFTHLAEVGRLLLQFPTRTDISFFVLLVFYFVFKFLTLFLLVRLARLPLTLPIVAFVFAVGELARELPIAIIFPALAIWKKEQFGGVRLIAVPFFQVVLELAAAFSFLALFGLGHWNVVHWIGIGGILIILLFLFFIEYVSRLVSFLPLIKKTGGEFFYSLRVLLDFKLVVRIFPLVMVYQLFLALVFFQIILAIGVENVSLPQAVAVFGANFVAAVLSPLPFDLGVTESTGFLILTQIGATPEQALSAMFAQRAIVALSSWFLFGVVLGLSFDKIKKLVQK